MNLISVFDRAVQSFMPPFAVAHNGFAIRSFSDEIKTSSETNALSKHPDDYELYQVGVFDDQTGAILPSVPPVLLITGTQVKSSVS